MESVADSLLSFLLVRSEDKNGDNFPDDESVAVSAQILCLYLLPSLISDPNSCILLLCCVTFPHSPLTRCVRNKISAPRTETDVWNREPLTGIWIPRQSLMHQPGLFLTAKVKTVLMPVYLCVSVLAKP